MSDWKDEEYNGHTNWHTWNASLWIGNEEFTYKHCVRLAQRAWSEANATELIRDFIESIEGFNGDGFESDKVDWDSIGEEYYQEYNEDEE